MVDYTKSWSRKQWTRRTEGVFKNIIDALREGKTLPKGFIMPTPTESEGFDLIVDPAEYTAPKGIAATKVFSVCIHARQNWVGTVTLSQSNNLCAGASVSLDDASVAVSAQTPKNCTYMRLSLPSNCPAGNYKITVTGICGSITRTFEVAIGVGVPPVPPNDEQPKPCGSDDDCKKYGDDWWCVGGECKKACGTASANCNSDYCAPGEKCIWNAGAGKCLCEKGNYALSCPYILVETGSGKSSYGVITITSVNGFEGSGNIIIYDANQPDQAPSSCMAAWLKYGTQSGNILPITLTADGSIAITVEVSSSCETEQKHYFGVEVEIGGKTAACIVTVEVKTTGFYYFSEIGDASPGNRCPYPPGCMGDPSKCQMLFNCGGPPPCSICLGYAYAILKVVGWSGTVHISIVTPAEECWLGELGTKKNNQCECSAAWDRAVSTGELKLLASPNPSNGCWPAYQDVVYPITITVSNGGTSISVSITHSIPCLCA